MKIDNIISSLGKNGSNLVRVNNSLKWCNGDRDKCKALFIEIFKAVDKTITKFQYLEEYDEVVNWMTDTKGKGLLLMGGCGKGKSIIATGVIPVLLKIATNCEVRPISAEQLGTHCDPTIPTMPSKPINLDYLLATGYPIIDDMGAEAQIYYQGDKQEGVNLIIDAAERRIRPLFITTNLNVEQIYERYGARTNDRLSRLCEVIEFEGADSFRQ